MTSASKNISVETKTAETSGIMLNLQLIVAFQASISMCVNQTKLYNVQSWSWWEGQDLTKETSLLVDFQSVTMDMMQIMLVLSAGLIEEVA